MNDLDPPVAGAMVTFIAVAGAYIAIRHRANETPVDSYNDLADLTVPTTPPRASNDAHGQVHRQAQTR